ncbi:MAG: nuclear transport factor 2 family protein [Acidimicrobiales bacterium]
MTAAIHRCLEQWHAYLQTEGGPDPAALELLIHDECVFYSPVVFTPQRGGGITRIYLSAAANTLGGSEEAPFRYTKEIVSNNQAMLEFETSVDGKTVNGVDIITCDGDGRIVEFKVMVRPLQGMNAVHEAMMSMLARMNDEAVQQ